MTTDVTEAPSSLARSTQVRFRGARLRRSLFILLEFAGLVLIWHFVVTVFDIEQFLLPGPGVVAETLVEDWRDLLVHARATVTEVAVGYSIAVGFGLTLAVAMVSSRAIERAIYPIIVMLQAIPKVAIAPLLVVWLGFGVAPIIATTAVIAFFPITVATIVGLQGIGQNMINLGRVMGLSWAQLFIKIRFPSSLPSVFGGLKVGMTLAVIGAVVGEFIGAEAGLGALILISTSALNTPTTFSAIIIIALVGVLLFWLIEVVERFSVPWHETQAREREKLL